MKRSNVGDWNQKSDLSREEVEKLCVGTWRPDEDACKFIVDELGMKTGQENPAEHWVLMQWTWRARLFVVDEKEKYRKTARYYLGEDDKGVYLAAECEDYYVPPRCILKFRKVPGSKQPSPLRGRAHSGM